MNKQPFIQRVLSLALAAGMTFTTLPASVLAQETTAAAQPVAATAETAAETDTPGDMEDVAQSAGNVQDVGLFAAAADYTLPYNADMIAAIGPQQPKQCTIYAMAYARTILDSKVQDPQQYWLNGTGAVWSRGSFTLHVMPDVQTLLQTLYDELNQRRPVILYVTGYYAADSGYHADNIDHYVTVVGYKNVKDLANLKESNFLAIDPGGANKFTLKDGALSAGQLKIYTTTGAAPETPSADLPVHAPVIPSASTSSSFTRQPLHWPAVPTSADAEWQGDYVYFGAFGEVTVTNTVLKAKLKEIEGWTEQTYKTIDDVLYYKVDDDYYHEKTPIRWQVLEATEDELYLLSEKSLAALPFDQGLTGSQINWSTSALRKWLNDDFWNQAFQQSMQEAILDTYLANGSMSGNLNPGSATYDKVFVLSEPEYRIAIHGFWNDSASSNTRVAGYMPWVENQITTGNSSLIDRANKTCGYWTRTLGELSYGFLRPVYTSYYGSIGVGSNVFNTWRLGIRPAIRIKTSSTEWHSSRLVCGIYLEKSEMELQQGDAGTLKYAVVPYEWADSEVMWSTSNNSVATVENQTVTAVRPGKTTITVTAQGGKTASCEVTVVARTTPTPKPTTKPTAAPTVKPTAAPTAKPTAAPTTKPTAAPTTKPTAAPTTKPTAAPTTKPTVRPTAPPVYDKSVAGFVARLYGICLGRDPDAQGLANWVQRLNNKEITGAEAAMGFVFSDEFKNNNYCNSCYVKTLYLAFFGREADKGGLADWVKRLESGVKREEIFNGFACSVEFGNLCGSYDITRGEGMRVPEYGTVPTGKCSVCSEQDGVTSFVTRMYKVALDRAPDAAGLKDWTGRLWSHTASGRDIGSGFIFSVEFKNKNYSNGDYVERLYEAFMGRASDAAGKSDWVGRLQKGASREEVFDGFAASAEFTNICNAYGILRG